MSEPTTRPDTATLPAPEVDADLLVDADGGNPWEGIPAPLLDGTHSYDHDCAGGCG